MNLFLVRPGQLFTLGLHKHKIDLYLLYEATFIICEYTAHSE
jgi:hypothetical protein